MKAPTRVLIVEDIETWAMILSRAARRAGASEVVVCGDLRTLNEALRVARFDVALLDVGLSPDDDINADGLVALEMIREKDGGGTRCILVTGWQGGDRLDLVSESQQKYGVDWAYMKEKYEAHAMIARISEMLDKAREYRLDSTPMSNLSAGMAPYEFDHQMLEALRPAGGMRTLYSAVSRLVSPAIPLVALHPDAPMRAGPGGIVVGVYWSRSLAASVAVGLAPADSMAWDEDTPIPDLSPFAVSGTTLEVVGQVRERNLLGWLWELPELGIEQFAT